MSSHADRLNRQVDKLQTIWFGTTTTLGNPSTVVSVALEDGTYIDAIAGNEINSSQVTVIKGNDGNYYCWSGTSPQTQLEINGAALIRPEDEEENVETKYPFQVLSFGDGIVRLGGDREETELGSNSGNLIGVTNLGNQDYLAAWYSQISCNITAVDSAQNIRVSSLPSCPFEDPVTWIGYGTFYAETIYQPEENLEMGETGRPLPADAETLPLYPVYQERFLSSGVVRGGKTSTQSEVNYDYSKTEEWEYEHSTAGGENPAAPPFLGLCNVPGLSIESPTFTRTTRSTYGTKTNSDLVTATQVFLNGQLYEGERRVGYGEVYSYYQKPALMTSFTAYVCDSVPIFGGINSTGSFVANFSSANWSGEKTTETRNYTSKIEEPDWDYPVNTFTTTLRRENYQKTYDFDLNYDVDSKSWFISGSFLGTFSFEVFGSETRQINWQENLDRLTPSLLFLGVDGSESFFTVITETQKTVFNSDRNRNIPKFLNNYTTDVPNVIQQLDVKTEDLYYDYSFFYSNRDRISKLDVEDSFYWEVESGTSVTGGGRFVVKNKDFAPVVNIAENLITHYQQRETFLPSGESEGKTYSEVIMSENPLLKSIRNREVYVLTSTKRYTGIIVDYVYQIESDPELEIATYRSVDSVIVTITGEEEYIGGILESGRIAIYPQDNCSALLRDKLLSVGHSSYCNLTQGTLYYSKSVVNQLGAELQSTEVYNIIDDVISYSGVESGDFIPVSGSSKTAISVAYYPIA